MNDGVRLLIQCQETNKQEPLPPERTEESTLKGGSKGDERNGFGSAPLLPVLRGSGVENEPVPSERLMSGVLM